MSESPPSAASRALFRFDPGWLYLLPGLALVMAAVLVPAVDDLAEARWRRDQAAALAEWRARRLENYQAYLDALVRGDETVMLSLAARSLNLMPADKELLIAEVEPATLDASPFVGLDPVWRDVAAPARPDSLLQRMASNQTTRLWLFGVGVLCCVVGLMPPATGGRARRHEGADGEMGKKGLAEKPWGAAATMGE